jgi:hypothetical protein
LAVGFQPVYLHLNSVASWRQGFSAFIQPLAFVGLRQFSTHFPGNGAGGMFLLEQLGNK